MSKVKPVATIDLCLTSEDSQTADSEISINTTENTMQTDQDTSSYKKSSEKSDSDSGRSGRKSDKRSESKDKPRIVLTFRSEKPGAKSSNMKIVSTEEKHDEKSPRRSTRLGTKGESDYECEVTIKNDKSKRHSTSEAEEQYDNSTKRPQRSTATRNHDTDNWNTKKEAQNETTVQRPSRRIKPTAKVLANQEMQGENQQRSGNEGVRTRAAKARLAARGKKHVKEVTPEADGDDVQSEKLEHLEGLGLKARDGSSKTKDFVSAEIEVEDDEDQEEYDDEQESEEEVDDDLEVINKLLEEDTDDEDFVGPSTRPRRRAAPTHMIDMHPYQQLMKRKKRRASPSSDEEQEEDNGDAAEAETADGSEEAAQPDAGAAISATCQCLQLTNIHAATTDLPEPVFCQAIETVDGVRVGCSHLAARDSSGILLPLVRCGPRTPYFLACTLHDKLLRNHMCCPSCGLFCTQGSFSRCSQGHLFHGDCGVGPRGGCPHCGVGGGAAPHCPLGAPRNTDVTNVHVKMNCSNKRMYLPEQREQCTAAFLSFAPLLSVKLPEGPIIPKDLLPPSTVDIPKLCKEADEAVVGDETEIIQRIMDGIVAGETVELVPKIVSARSLDLNKPVDSGGTTLVHIAATHGKLFALHVLRSAGASVDLPDSELRTPIMAAIQELLDKSPKEAKKSPKSPKEDIEIDEEIKEKEDIKMEVTEAEEANAVLAEVKTEIDLDDEPNDKENCAIETTTVPEAEEEEKITEVEEQAIDNSKETTKKVVDSPSEEEKVILEVTKKDMNAKNEDLIKVIRYLVAAGADLDIAGAEGMTALHMAAQLGGATVCGILLESARAAVDVADNGGWTPLVYAAENKHREVVKVLLAAGADPSVPDVEGHAPVHWCSVAGDHACLEMMLDAAQKNNTQPDVINLPNAAGDTPLHVAGRQDHYACVVTLLARGARTDLENSVGELAVEVCAEACRASVSLHMQMAICAGARLVDRLMHSDISNGRERFPIPCMNSVDDEKPPADFMYVTELLAPKHVYIDTTIDTMKGCSCVGACTTGCACTAVSVGAWLGARGALAAAFPLHDPPLLFQCNHTCGCNPKLCTNNAISRLLKTGSVWVRSEVYRVGGGRGWGLRCSAPVPRGAPVAAYTGELLYSDDADQRSPDQYMFAIDVKPDLLEQCSDKRLLCVDAARLGGGARFMNHSCRPALAPLRVLTTHRDLRLPTIAFFAVRDLPAYTPLTFDYGDKFWSVKSKYMSCECGEPDCKYPTKTTDEMET